MEEFSEVFKEDRNIEQNIISDEDLTLIENDKDEVFEEDCNIEQNIVSHEDLTLIENDKDMRGDDTAEPFIGMEFQSLDDVENYYNKYAKRVGFSIRKDKFMRSRTDKKIIGRQMVCSKEGSRAKKYLKKTHLRGAPDETREWCKAALTVAKRGERWVVTRYFAGHNHELATPKSTQFLRSHRQSSKAQRDLMDVLLDSGVRPSKVISVLSHESGGIDQLTMTESDIYNYLSWKREKLIERGDAQMMLDYFRNCQSKDPRFFYVIQTDIDGCLANCFWVDSRSQLAYKYFGDVVTFDPTYLTNKYKMPFVPIAGVNHHFQSILFGCALLWDETEETFTWLLNTWLEAMSRKPPSMIITDQDTAISNAIAEILPNIVHHYCMWHIEKKFPETLSRVYHQNEDFKKEFNNCIHRSTSPEKFEDAWMRIMIKYNLEENSWLKKIYSIREKWVPAFVRRIFCAGMSTTQRSEGLNKFFKDYVNASTRVSSFVKEFEKALDNRYNKERHQNFKTMNSKPVLKTLYPMETEASQVYTRKIFKLFQNELIGAQKFVSDKVEDCDDFKVYHVHEISKEKPFYKVSFDASSSQAQCSCKKFEFMGILCCHILTIFLKKKVHSLLERDVLKRWTRDAKEYICPASAQCSLSGSSDSSVMWFDSVMVQSLELSELGARSLGHYELAITGIAKLIDELRGLKYPIVEVEEKYCDNTTISCETILRDPIQVVTKGRPKSMRIKSSVEKNSKKKSHASKEKRKNATNTSNAKDSRKRHVTNEETNPSASEFNSSVLMSASTMEPSLSTSFDYHQNTPFIPLAQNHTFGYVDLLMAASSQSKTSLLPNPFESRLEDHFESISEEH